MSGNSAAPRNIQIISEQILILAEELERAAYPGAPMCTTCWERDSDESFCTGCFAREIAQYLEDVILPEMPPDTPLHALVSSEIAFRRSAGASE